MSLSSIILMGVVVGVVAMVLMGLFWKLDWLKIVTKERWDVGDGIMYDLMRDGVQGRSESGQKGGGSVYKNKWIFRICNPRVDGESTY